MTMISGIGTRPWRAMALGRHHGRSMLLDARARGGLAYPILLVAGLIVTAVGWIGVLGGRLIKAAVARQRESLADATAVQVTRDPDALAQALLEIHEGSGGGSRLQNHRAEEVSHMGFGRTLSGVTGLTATPRGSARAWPHAARSTNSGSATVGASGVGSSARSRPRREPRARGSSVRRRRRGQCRPLDGHAGGDRRIPRTSRRRAGPRRPARAAWRGPAGGTHPERGRGSGGPAVTARAEDPRARPGGCARGAARGRRSAASRARVQLPERACRPPRSADPTAAAGARPALAARARARGARGLPQVGRSTDRRQPAHVDVRVRRADPAAARTGQRSRRPLRHGPAGAPSRAGGDRAVAARPRGRRRRRSAPRRPCPRDGGAARSPGGRGTRVAGRVQIRKP